MSIFPLPQFEADIKADEEDRLAYERLKSPDTIVVRFGAMRLVGEFPYEGSEKPGCGSKIVVRTHRGVEMGEMLTSTCPNAGCSKAVTRKEMLEYIENSGGRDYPFYEKGKALRVATARDLAEQSLLESQKPAMLKLARERSAALGLNIKIVEAEPILGGNRLAFYFTSEERVDFRDLVLELSKEYSTRIELRQVGARDEARLIADYERCGQHCCCKQFLKVLKPVSMRSAKVQKATLDPLKISGRCGRLMCCLRYEDESYSELVKRLPKMKRRVGTPEGPGIVVDRQILTQLLLVKLDHDNRRIAVPVEDLCDPDDAPKPGLVQVPRPEPKDRGGSKSRDRGQRDGPGRREPAEEKAGERERGGERKKQGKRRSGRRGGKKRSGGGQDVSQGRPEQAGGDASGGANDRGPGGTASPSGSGAEGEAKPKRRRRRRRGGKRSQGPKGSGGGTSSD